MNNKKQLHKALRKQVRLSVPKLPLVAAFILCTLAFAFRHLPADMAPACIHGHAPERTQHATNAKETKDNIYLYYVFILLPTSISDQDTEYRPFTRQQLKAPGLQHLMARVPLTGPMSRQLLSVGPAYIGKTPIENQRQRRWSTKAPTPCLL